MSISSKGSHRRSRSTRRRQVATRAQRWEPSRRIHDYLRLLYARIGVPHCPNDGSPVARQTPQQIVDQILELDEGTKFQVLAPVIRGRKGEYEVLLKDLAKDGFSRARIDGEIRDLTEDIKLDRYFQHTIEVVVDRLVRKDGIERRLTDSLETALGLAEGVAHVAIVDGPMLSFSQHFACPECGLSFEDLQPRNFSFNSPYGACPECSGIGTRYQVDPALVVPQPDKALSEGAIAPWGGRHRQRYFTRVLAAVAAAKGVDMDKPFATLTEAQQTLFLYGDGEQPYDVSYENRFGRRRRYQTTYEGVIPWLERRYNDSESEGRESYHRSSCVRSPAKCAAGHGSTRSPSPSPSVAPTSSICRRGPCASRASSSPGSS